MNDDEFIQGPKNKYNLNGWKTSYMKTLQLCKLLKNNTNSKFFDTKSIDKNYCTYLIAFFRIMSLCFWYSCLNLSSKFLKDIKQLFFGMSGKVFRMNC